MPLRLAIKRLLTARSDRVKCVDLHPTEPWALVALYNGDVHIWNYEQQEMLKTFEVTELPVRCCRFVPRKQWIIVGSDDMMIRVYNYNTMEKIKTIEAHNDYIRSIAVHPTLPLFLSSSDDMSIKLWDWDKNFKCTQIFDGHTHYVMAVVFNPKDPNTFASASLDRTVKVWNLASGTTPNFTLEGHDKGVNCVDYFAGGDKPHLISGADDKCIKIWDYQNRTCVATLQEHAYNVSVVAFHPELPIIISGSEDGTVKLWHSSTYRLEDTLNYGMERVWALSALKGQKTLCLGYDEGMVMLKLGHDQPRASMSIAGKVIWAKHSDIQSFHLKQQSQQIEGENVGSIDGEKLVVVPKDLGSCEVYPQKLEYSPTGAFVLVCGDGEYIIYTGMAFRNKSFGKAIDVSWAAEGNTYAVVESTSVVKVFADFKERNSMKVMGCTGIFGGPLITLTTKSSVYMYDWNTLKRVRKIDVKPTMVLWSQYQGKDDPENETAVLVCVATEDSFYILQYLPEVARKFHESGAQIPDGGVEDSFVVVHEVAETLQSAKWVGDVLIYTNSRGRLNYCVGKESFTIAHLDRQLFVLGYLPQLNRVYLVDREYNVLSYSLDHSMLMYYTHVIRGDDEEAENILPSIPINQRNQLARFLDSIGKRELALEVAVDPDQRFDMAIQLSKLEVAHSIALESDAEGKWRQLATMATEKCMFNLAAECHEKAKDWSSLLLMNSCLSDAEAMERLASNAENDGANNVAFLAYFLTGNLDKCVDLLKKTGRIPEAAFFSRTYLPSHVSDILNVWRQDLSKVNAKAASALADPAEYGNLFPDMQIALRAEKRMREERSTLRSSVDFPNVVDPFFIEALKEQLEREQQEEEEEMVEEVKEEEEREEEVEEGEELNEGNDKQEEEEEAPVAEAEVEKIEDDAGSIPDMDPEET